MELLGKVILVVNGKQHNGSYQHVAIVNRQWDAPDAEKTSGAVGYVNCMLFPDCGTPYCETSILVFDTEGAASGYVQDTQEKRGTAGSPTVAFITKELL